MRTLFPIALLAAALLGAACSGEDERQDSPPPPEPAFEVTATEVGVDPWDVAAGAQGVWVVNNGDGTLERVAPSTEPPIRVGESPVSVAVSGDTVWVGHRRAPVVMAIDAASGERVGKPIRLAPPKADYALNGIVLAAGTEAVWAVAPDFDSLWRIEVETRRVSRPLRVGAQPFAVAVGDGYVWVANTSDGTVSRVEEGSGELVGAPIPVGTGPVALAVADGVVWVANREDGTVIRLDAATGDPVESPIELGGRPSDLVVSNGAVWVTNATEGTVARIDAASGEVDPIPVGERPIGIAAGEGAVWVVNALSGTVSRIEARNEGGLR